MDPFHHVRDGGVWELPKFALDMLGRHEQIVLPVIFGVQLTKYMVLQVVAAVLVFIIFRGLSRRVAGGKPATGVFWNFWEMLALYVRDDIVRPSIGIPHDDHGHGGHGHDELHAEASHGHDDHSSHSHATGASVEVGHPADKYLPYVWSVFFYVLFCNLLGAVPLLGSPTADINVTGVLALVTFLHVVYFGSQKSGFTGFLKSLVPHMDLPGPIAVILLPFCQYYGWPYSAGRISGFYRGRGWFALGIGGPCEYSRSSRYRNARVVCRLPAGVCVCVVDVVIH
jgi:F-type H+-transporting ATPase subunit a